MKYSAEYLRAMSDKGAKKYEWVPELEQICEMFWSRTSGKDPAAILASLAYLLAVHLAESAKDEGHLLDGIRIATDDTRTLACELFVKYRQKIEGAS